MFKPLKKKARGILSAGLFLIVCILNQAVFAQERIPLGRCVAEAKVDPKIPTVVIVHGWRYRNDDFTAPPQELVEMGREIRARVKATTGKRINVLYYIWPGASRPLKAGGLRLALICRECMNIGDSTSEDGRNLAKQLRGLLGRSYREPVHFVAHSFGAFVTAHAVEDLSQQSAWRSAVQITTLDTSFMPTRMGSGGILKLLSAKSESGLHVTGVENIMGIPFYGVGTPLLGWGPTVPHSNTLVGRGHFGVIRYYRQTATGEISSGGFNQSFLLGEPEKIGDGPDE